ncbi:MAG: hypothetical protein AB7D57_03075 [Desulfovibrionaceae bacterium]
MYERHTEPWRRTTPRQRLTQWFSGWASYLRLSSGGIAKQQCRTVTAGHELFIFGARPGESPHDPRWFHARMGRVSPAKTFTPPPARSEKDQDDQKAVRTPARRALVQTPDTPQRNG